MDRESFNLMRKYLLFCATFSPVPLGSVLDTKIKENIEKGGHGNNIAFWNWTPGQKSLLDSDVRRVIFRSYWSTGKTRVMFEKAKTLAASGETVLFILFHDSESWPIFLFCTLMNEIKKSGLDEKFHLIMGNDLQGINCKENYHIFIDELAIISLECGTKLDNLLEHISQESYAWVTIGRRGPFLEDQFDLTVSL